MRIANLLAICIPFVGLVAAASSLWGVGFGFLHLSLLLGMYILTAIGITVGYHRLFTHRSFETNRVVQCVLAILGSMAVEGPVLRWVAQHRRHHKHSDKQGDPHSPHLHGRGFLGMLRGLWHAHLGWICLPDPPNLARYIPDLAQNRLLRTVSGLFPLWMTLGLLAPALVAGVWTGTWTGAFLGLLWGGLVRVFFVHHVTWSVNSICHLWGSQPYKCHDHSKNNLLIAILALGEGWHNNHHAFPTSARHGLKWWQFDASYLIIRLLSWVGLAWNIKLPAPRLVAVLSVSRSTNRGSER